MIYTCTLNPAIDLFIETDELKPNIVNRTNSYNIQPNGKGVNVSFILKKLGIDNQAIGIGGGFTNKYIINSLSEKGISNKFIETEEVTRINVFTRVLSDNTEYKEVNKGPHVSQNQIEDLIQIIKGFTSKDTLIISGSFAKGISPTILEKIGKLSENIGFKLVIDTSYDEVKKVLKYKPLLLKPNNEELTKWFDVEGDLTKSELMEYSYKLLDLGAQNVLLSLGGKGAIFINKKYCLYGNVPKGKVVNTACSGDTMLGTFIAGMEQKKSVEENFKFSIAAASSTAFRVGLTDFSDVNELVQQIEIKDMEGRRV